jgi:drug/metabolite transporter (DMT)-like permease
MAVAYLSLSVATLIWASNAIAVKYALREIPQMATAAMRITLAALTLLVVYTARGGRLRLAREEAGKFLRVGLWGLALSFFLFTLGLNHTSVSHAVFVGALTPLAILLFSWREGLERLSALRLAALFISLAGVVMLALDQQGGASPGWEGDLLLVAGVGCFTFYTVRGKQLAATYQSMEFNAHCFLAAAIWLFPLLVFELARLPWAAIGWRSWTGLLLSGTFGSAGAYLAYFYSLRSIQASQAAVFHYLQPVLGTMLGVLFFQEILTGHFLLGAALILTGVVLAERR